MFTRKMSLWIHFNKYAGQTLTDGILAAMDKEAKKLRWYLRTFCTYTLSEEMALWIFHEGNAFAVIKLTC